MNFIFTRLTCAVRHCGSCLVYTSGDADILSEAAHDQSGGELCAFFL